MSKDNCFYNNLLKPNSYQFINNNYIPGAFPTMNTFIKSYYDLVDKFQKREDLGYYICKDCGFLYEVKTKYPTVEEKCPNGHIIGGLNNLCSKMDIRVYRDIKELNEYKNKYPDYDKSFVSKTLEEYKKEYVDQDISRKMKGITKDYRYIDFEKNDSVRNLNIITYRVLNFVLYSFLLFTCEFIPK
jgi:hypothetical protein